MITKEEFNKLSIDLLKYLEKQEAIKLNSIDSEIIKELCNFYNILEEKAK